MHPKHPEHIEKQFRTSAWQQTTQFQPLMAKGQLKPKLTIHNSISKLHKSIGKKSIYRTHLKVISKLAQHQTSIATSQHQDFNPN